MKKKKKPHKKTKQKKTKTNRKKTQTNRNIIIIIDTYNYLFLLKLYC